LLLLKAGAHAHSLLFCLSDQKDVVNTPLPGPDPVSAALQAKDHVPGSHGAHNGGSRAVPGTSALTTRAMLQVVADQAGPEGVDRVLDRAGLHDQRVQLQSVEGRISYPEKLRLFEAAAAELADPRIGLLLGPAVYSDPANEPLRKLGRAEGSPAAAFEGISRISTRLDSAAVFRCERAGAGTAVLAWKVLPPYRPSRIDCDYNTGFLAHIPVLFGLLPARVDHGAGCQLNGAPECIYHVGWTEPPVHRVRRLLRRFKHSEPAPGRQSSAEHRLQVLEGAASDLVSSAPLEEVLDRIAARADSAVHAPGHLLAVRLPAGGCHVRVRGTGEVLAAALGDDGVTLAPAASSLAGLPVLSVPVASAKRFYGMLAAVAHPGQDFFPEDTDTLAAYARHAAASLDIAEVVAEAREQGETAQLLLNVSRSLAERSTVGTVAGSIADAVPALSGADRSAVALWDADAGKLRIAGMSGWHGELKEKLAEYVVTARDSPELSELLAHGAPLLVDRNGSDWARDMLAGFNLSALAAVPIMAGDQLAGIVLAHWAEGTAPESLNAALAERLSGLAGLAAVALDNIRLLEEARRQALHDPLTGLPNRALLENRLETALAQVDRNGRRVGLLFCDVNRFKRINDSLGHGAGDHVLRHVAGRLSTAVRSSDTVARYSGDEFVILLPDIATSQEAEQVAARIRASLADPLEVNGGKIFVDAAIGTAASGALPYQGTDAPAQAARQLIAEADLDMYRSKARARGRTLHRVQRRDGLRLETDLRGAAGRGELRVYFQPQIDLATNNIIGAEALVRWQHPELGLLSPAQFIPLAEESNLIGEVGAHVLAEACRTAASWQAAGHPIEISVNISAAQLAGTGFTALVRDTLAQTRLPAAALTLEVTESQVVSETSMNDGSLHDLRSLGVGISIDDFGTGYSSLARLHQLPVTEVKIDRSFTARLADDGSDGFVSGIVGLGQGLGLRVVAEGVETGDQLDALHAIGCERAQGYLFGKPVEAIRFEEQLGAGTRR
jgi:diguanylate cyclase (GGDEF)-like protein